jgi:hypothetical protein
VALHVQAVLQPQRTEFFLAQLARQTPANLIGVLRDSFVNDSLVDLIVLVHSGAPSFCLAAGALGCAARQISIDSPARTAFRRNAHLLMTKTAMDIGKIGLIVINLLYIAND